MSKKKRPLKQQLMLNILIILLKTFFFIQQFFVRFKQINYPEGQFILSILHCHQCVVYGIKDKEKFYVLISSSNDGEIISKAIEIFKLKSIRGSSKRHGVSAALSIIDKLKEGNSLAIMVDGPRGPFGVVKEGIVTIAKNSGVPIVPVAWSSKDKTFLKFNTWDRFRIPFGFCRTIVLYGDPIHIPSELTDEETKNWCIRIEQEMARLQKDLDDNYEIYRKL